MLEATKVAKMTEVRKPLESLRVGSTSCFQVMVDCRALGIGIGHGEYGAETAGFDGCDQSANLDLDRPGILSCWMKCDERYRILERDAEFPLQLRSRQKPRAPKAKTVAGDSPI